MFNDRIGAYESLVYLWGSYSKKYPKDKFGKVQIAYNTNESVLRQLYQVYRQKVTASSLNFWRSIGTLFDKIDTDEIGKATIVLINSELNSDRDLAEQTRSYKNSIKDGFRIITVAHSQGNLYTNFSFREIDSNLTSMVSVATPDSYVYGDGPYFTFKSDGIIKYILEALPPNIVRTNAGYFDHEFVNHYLKDEPTKEKILLSIHEAIQNPTYSGWKSLNPIEGYFNSDMTPSLKWLKSAMEGKNKLSSGECIVAESIFKVFALWGRECDGRNYSTLEEAVHDCTIPDNPEGGGSTACPYYGGLALDATRMHAYPAESNSFYKTHSECDWSFQHFKKVKEQGSLEAMGILKKIKSEAQ
jgi:hypothetical protein